MITLPWPGKLVAGRVKTFFPYSFCYDVPSYVCTTLRPTNMLRDLKRDKHVIDIEPTKKNRFLKETDNWPKSSLALPSNMSLNTFFPRSLSCCEDDILYFLLRSLNCRHKRSTPRHASAEIHNNFTRNDVDPVLAFLRWRPCDMWVGLLHAAFGWRCLCLGFFFFSVLTLSTSLYFCRPVNFSIIDFNYFY
jgi:hypothetical protein